MRKARRICATPGCPELTDAPYCPACETKRPKPIETRPSAPSRGYDARWRRYSEAYRRTHAHCRLCAKDGRVGPAELVDHIEPVSGPGDPLFWRASNHQPLCRSCHATKTQGEGRTAKQEAPGFPIGASPYRWTFA